MENAEWIGYHVELIPGRRRPEQDDKEFKENNKKKLMPLLDPLPVLPKSREEVCIIPREHSVTDKTSDEERSTPLSRHVLDKVQKELMKEKEKMYFAMDGSALAFSPQVYSQFYEPDHIANVIASTKGGVSLLTAPGSKPNDAPQTGTGILSRYCQVVVNKPFDEDHEAADRMGKAYFLVKLTRTHVVPYCVAEGRVQALRDGRENAQQLCQAMNIIMRSDMMQVMIASGRSSRSLSINEKMMESERGILGDRLHEKYPRSHPYMPLYCIQYDVEMLQDLCASMKMTPEMRFFHRPNIPLLQVDGPSIAGVKIPSVTEKITDRETKRALERAIKNVDFHVIYIKGPKWKTEMKRKNWDDKKIERFTKRSFRNRRVVKDDPFEWDPHNHKFNCSREGPDGEEIEETHTVATYYKASYDIEIKYQHLPLVKIKMGSRVDYFPVEFLFQAFGKVKGANSRAIQDENHSTEKIEQVKAIFAKLQQRKVELPALMEQFGLKVEEEPRRSQATVLKAPIVQFANQRELPQNGSFNLKGKEFASPAHIMSFAIIDCSERKDINVTLRDLFRAAEKHCITLPRGVDLDLAIQTITVPAEQNYGPSQMESAFLTALRDAREFWLSDSGRYYEKNKIWFESRVLRPQSDETLTCLVLPHKQGQPKSKVQRVGIMLKSSVQWATHKVVIAGREHYARLKVQVRRANEFICVDPFNYRGIYDRCKCFYEAKVSNGWENVSDPQFVYELDQEHGELCPESSAESSAPAIEVKWYLVECPTVLFVYFSERETNPYHFVKLLSSFSHGIPSQCIVERTKNQQKNTAQYYSNIALKLNSKLSIASHEALAWTIEMPGSASTIFSKEIMVMGLAQSKSDGQDGVFTIVGSCFLKGMQIAQAGRLVRQTSRSAIGAAIPTDVIQSITETLIGQYKRNVGAEPKQVLIYRDGGSEGDMPAMLKQEAVGIEKAFGINISMTFVVCINQHNIVIVPNEKKLKKQGRNGVHVENVKSGTCCDNSALIMPLMSKLSIAHYEATGFPPITESEINRHSFLLTSQEGLKGTSKPVLYRTLLKSKGLDAETLQNITYSMSFQYGTATKAIRGVPVVYYSRRLAEQLISFIPYLTEYRLIREEVVGDDEIRYIRDDVADGDNNQEMLPAFSPSTQKPYCPHLSA